MTEVDVPHLQAGEEGECQRGICFPTGTRLVMILIATHKKPVETGSNSPSQHCIQTNDLKVDVPHVRGRFNM